MEEKTQTNIFHEYSYFIKMEQMESKIFKSEINSDQAKFIPIFKILIF